MFDLSDEPLDQSRFSRRQKTSMEGHTVWLPAAEDVIVQKLRWAKLGKRDKDLADAAGFLKVREGKLDWAYIEKWCEELGILETLAQASARAKEKTN